MMNYKRDERGRRRGREREEREGEKENFSYLLPSSFISTGLLFQLL
jgi:hypothetical protein